MKVCVLVQDEGQYEDRTQTILGVFSTKEKAQAAAKIPETSITKQLTWNEIDGYCSAPYQYNWNPANPAAIHTDSFDILEFSMDGEE